MSAVPDLQLAVQYASGRRGIPAVRSLRNWAEAALQGRRRQRELLIRIVGRRESAALNERYRHKNGPTNVLSFPFDAPVPTPHLGDLVICAPVVAAEAKAQGKPARAHWAHMVVHGVLHLQGYDHLNAADASRMEGLEQRILKRLGFPDPYRDDAR